MKTLHTLAAHIRRGEPVPAPLGAVLRMASLGQRAGMWLRQQRPRTRVSAHVVSYGNLTAGGVGKTPAVIARTREECASGRRVAVLTRGYGGMPVHEPAILAPGLVNSESARTYGDEAALIARRAPHAWIVRAADRVAAAHAALDLGCDLLILDDGFQAVTLERDENIVLIDATNPFGNGAILPRGILREPLSALGRATQLLLTRCDQAPATLAALERRLQHYAPGIAMERTMHQPTHLWRPWDDAERPLGWLRNKPVRLVSAIGNPEAFAHTLTTLGAHITDTHALADHAAIPEALLKGSVPVIITEKDAVRLQSSVPSHVYALAVTFLPYVTPADVHP